MIQRKYVAAFLLLVLPAFASASGSVATTLADMLGLEGGIAKDSGFVMFSAMTFLLTTIIVYGVLSEIRIFMNNVINVLVAVLGSAMLVPTKILGQMVTTLYTGGFATIAAVFSIGLLPAFIRKFGPRLGMTGNVLELLAAATYGFAVFTILGLLVKAGSLSQEWQLGISVGLAAIVCYRGYVARRLAWIPHNLRP